jgi:hypothetical protein
VRNVSFLLVGSQAHHSLGTGEVTGPDCFCPVPLALPPHGLPGCFEEALLLMALQESFSTRTVIATRNLHKISHAHTETMFTIETQCKLSQRTRYRFRNSHRFQ